MKHSSKEKIQKHYPNLEINQVEANDIGQNNDVFIVNDALVFRFPKYEAGVRKLRKEAKVLDHLKRRVYLPIPEPLYKHLNDEAGEVFTGYPLIPGTPLWSGDLKRMNGDKQQELASELVGFLKEMHDQPVDELDIPKQTTEEIKRSTRQLYVDFQQKLFPHMNEKSKQDVSKKFENFLADEELLNFRTTLIHGDFGPSNILWNPSCQSVSGVIDFGETEIGDPAYDFAGLLSGYGEDFVKRCLRDYPQGEHVLERVRFYKSTFALQEALHGVNHGDAKAFENGIKEYR
ncbi:aminoglycoside phosphotransferase family protein [Halobacillus litoralis]|uniref:phosphotransferase family protein n=1 Tax=Halobacillus litoralis TaxID=45668 RepID=UPI001CD5E5E3|nr:aminoglycoside phosphotransferase family protein [Halobacillus litoralis]MCA0970881.1 aminoglycoside phosphotransferase family protein [Halobacillus litoralis]